MGNLGLGSSNAGALHDSPENWFCLNEGPVLDMAFSVGSTFDCMFKHLMMINSIMLFVQW